ncbi:hypothetical protein ENUP19_0248G0115 [Entamoeba nuttalli]|uniref:Long-chain-fatty-acid--CoA ligase, putative n=2 Tax=Entamoeba nuttalli TaxID=412467 RepID=K2H539_ENTNP|nr:long-chain-fatty-acid--CoA ligase, putative [Entamoeba nuttalli P19]EKE37584.1 long-chain-fatty-acid--CoA ligase, putative [Entamoeba nuttalli P19]|eukprot:XP_008860110.1 long-chain-fatty-acid--CoA ligase, putative [Entamoeba nuttalli P19]
MDTNHRKHTIYVYPDDYEKNGNKLLVSDHLLIHSPIDAVEHWVEDDPDHPFIGERKYIPGGKRGEYEYYSYKEVLEYSKTIARGLIKMGIKKGDNLGFFSRRRLEWHYLFIACSYIGARICSLYESLGKEAVKYIIGHAELKYIFTSNEKIKVLEEVGCLKNIIFINEFEVEQPSKDGILTSFLDVYKLGLANTDILLTKVKPEDDALLMYTSGTTGFPKGVPLTHENLISCATSLVERIPLELLLLHPRGTDPMSSISFLPLAHVFAIVLEMTIYRLGGVIGLMSQGIPTLVEDIKLMKPVVLAAVPRVLQTIYSKVMEGLRETSCLTQLIYNSAFYLKEKRLEFEPTALTPSFDNIFFGPIKEKFGGKLQIIISAGAPLTEEIAKFFRIVIVDALFIGYGLTETTGMGLASQFSNGIHLDVAGRPYPTVMAKIECVPEMGFCTQNEECCGEIYLKTTAGFKGYYKESEEYNNEHIKDGWIKTNDIVKYRKDHDFEIIARANNIFKLSQGEYISTEKIENILQESNYVKDIFVDGKSTLNYLYGIIVPQFIFLRKEIIGTPLENKTDEELCKNPKIIEIILNDLNKVASEHGLMGYEKVKRIILHPYSFDIERDLITPSLKIKRNNVKKYFEREITELLKN